METHKCDTCQHAVSHNQGTRGCSWSIHFEPVPGWKATPTWKNSVASYAIEDCPQYWEDGSVPQEPQKRGMRHPSQPVIGVCLETGERRSWPSMQRAQKDGFQRNGIRDCCLGKQKTHKGWVFTWAQSV